MHQKGRLLANYLTQAEGFTRAETFNNASPFEDLLASTPFFGPILARITRAIRWGGDPCQFTAVVAYKIG